MALTTESTKRNRIYARMFDHEEAQRLRAEGWTWSELSRHFDVSLQAIRRVCLPHVREKMNERSKASLWAARKPCTNGCGRLTWQHMKGRTGLCHVCWGLSRSAEDVREGELRCTFCNQWKPDSEFGKGKARSRRYHRTECRACATRIRREFRRRHPEQERVAAQIYYYEVRREKRGVMAEYVVLQLNGDKTYHEIERVEAVSPDLAIEKAARDQGEYVAVVASRWDIVAVQPRTSLRVVREK